MHIFSDMHLPHVYISYTGESEENRATLSLQAKKVQEMYTVD